MELAEASRFWIYELWKTMSDMPQIYHESSAGIMGIKETSSGCHEVD